MRKKKVHHAGYISIYRNKIKGSALERKKRESAQYLFNEAWTAI